MTNESPPSRIVLSLEHITKDRPGVYINPDNSDFTIHNKTFPSEQRRGRWHYFSRLPNNRLVLAPDGLVRITPKKIIVDGHEAATVLRLNDIEVSKPFVLAVKRTSINDEQLVKYSFPEDDSEPLIIHQSFLEEPIFYMYLGLPESSGAKTRIRFEDGTPRPTNIRR